MLTAAWRLRSLLDVFLLALLPVIGGITAMRVGVRIATGPSWDTYAFLDNAADMAGRSVGYVEPHRPPMLPFLTSLVLRFGAWNVSTIQIVDGALTVVGVIAFYLLMRRRFERPLAFAGSVLLLLVPPLWAWLGSGYTDFPSVALSICAMLLFVKATEDDPRWYWIAFPMLLFSILTRFGAFLMILPVVLWLMLRAKPFRQAKEIASGLGLMALAYVPAALYYFKYYSDPFFPVSFAGKVASAGLTGASTSRRPPVGVVSIPGWYFVRNLPHLLLQSPSDLASTLFLMVTALGLLTGAVALFARQGTLRRIAPPLAALLLVLLMELKGGSMLRAAAMVVLGFAIARSLLPDPAQTVALDGTARTGPFRTGWLDPTAALALDATMLVWGLLFFDAHGHMQPQIARYFITMAPAALYFVALGWRTLGTEAIRVVRSARSGSATAADAPSRWTAAPAIAALGVLALMGAYLVLHNYFPARTPARDVVISGAEKTAEWLIANDKDVRHKTVYSDVWPLTSWYLGQEAFAMPTFESAKAFPHELDKNKVDYFVTLRARRYPGYKAVYGAGSTTVLKYDSSFLRTLPAIAYLGDGWDAYAEEVCNFDFNLYFPSSRSDGTWMLDASNAEALSKYDAVAVFGARWQNKAVAEKTLRKYVNDGGSLIIDASHNMDGFFYPLVDTVFMDVLVRRWSVPASSVMSVTPELARESQVPTSFAPGPFVDEGGGPWWAANYAPSPWAHAAGSEAVTYEVLASLGSRPAILLEHMGRGRIYWVSSNLLWHTFLEGDQNEIRLVRGLFRQAVDLPPIPDTEVASKAKPWFVSKKVRLAAKAARKKAQPVTKAPTARAASGTPAPQRGVAARGGD